MNQFFYFVSNITNIIVSNLTNIIVSNLTNITNKKKMKKW